MKRVLIISKQDFPLLRLEQHFSKNLAESYRFLTCCNYKHAEELLVATDAPVSLLIFDIDVEGVLDFLKRLKSEELFSFLPLLALFRNHNVSFLQKLLNLGCSYFLEYRHIKLFFLAQVENILLNSSKVIDLEQRMSKLQDKALRDFILLDITKNYLPRAIWKEAENFAAQQRFNIPEVELEQSICFADICNFTEFSQYRSPREVINMLNLLFEIATRHIYRFGGDVDKFIGDAFLALFADPYSAVLAMYSIQKEIENFEFVDTPVMKFRIGVHIGRIIRGNVGGNERYDNTLIGDAVNTASRLEGKSAAGGVVISEELRRRLQINIPHSYRCIGELKGRYGQETYWQLFDFLESSPHVLKKIEKIHNQFQTYKKISEKY